MPDKRASGAPDEAPYGYNWTITVGARIDLEGIDPDEAQRRTNEARRVVKQVLASLGLRPMARATLRPREDARAR